MEIIDRVKKAWKTLANDSGGTSNTSDKKDAYPYNNESPTVQTTSSAVDSRFKKTIKDTDREAKYDRGIGGKIVDEIVDAALKNKFYIDLNKTKAEPDNALTKRFTKLYTDKIHTEFDKALKWSRLYGCSFILMGLKDQKDPNKSNLNEQSTPGSTAEYICAIPKTWVMKVDYEMNTNGKRVIPWTVKSIQLKPEFSGITIHSSRLITVINPSLKANLTDFPGTSVLDRPFNIITVLDSMIWSSGQTLWRISGGLMGVYLPPDADEEDNQIVLDTLAEINAKSVITFPDGYEGEIMSGANAAINPEPYFESMCTQLSGVTEYPKTILLGLATGAVTGSNNDRVTYYSKVITKQEWMKPYLVTILKKFAPDVTEDWDLVWNSPYELNDTEKLENKKTQADIDTAKILAFVMTPDEIRARDGAEPLTKPQIEQLETVTGTLAPDPRLAKGERNAARDQTKPGTERKIN